MMMTSQTKPVSGLLESFQEASTAFVNAWVASYRRRRQKQLEEEELRSLDPRTLADMGIEFAPELSPSLIHSKAEAMTIAVTAMVGAGQKTR